MSINEIMNKIKRNKLFDKYDILWFLIITLISISSFGLGRLTIKNKDLNREIEILNENLSASVYNISDNNIKKVYVASKNGKLYYGIYCSGANKIAEHNKIYFANKEDAEIAGFTLSKNCK